MIVRLGLMDEDERFTGKLAAYFQDHMEETVRLELCLFTNLEECNEYLQKSGVLDILLATPQTLPDPAALYKQVNLAYFGEDKSMTAWADFPVICKYQKASAILRSVLGLAASLSQKGGRYSLGESGIVLLFAGVCGGVGCTTAAMACAATMAAAGKRTVYFSLQQNAEPETVFGGHGASMSEVHYHYQEWQRSTSGTGGEEGQRGLQLKLKSLLATDERTRVDSFASFTLPLDALDFTPAEAVGLVRALSAMYEYCVVDMDGQLGDALVQMLPIAQWTILVGDGTDKSNRAMQRLIESIRQLNNSQDPVLGGELATLYNRFGSRAQRAADIPGFVKKLGEIPNYSHADQGAIVQEIAKGPMFTILERSGEKQV